MNKISILGFILIFALIGTIDAQNKKPEQKAKQQTEQVKAKVEQSDKALAGKKGPDGQPVYEGAKGGLYYINKNGNKTYLKDNDPVIPEKKGPDGQPVYKGSQGGEYYYNKSGAKTYLKSK
jgi:hypothetical protein